MKNPHNLRFLILETAGKKSRVTSSPAPIPLTGQIKDRVNGGLSGRAINNGQHFVLGVESWRTDKPTST